MVSIKPNSLSAIETDPLRNFKFRVAFHPAGQKNTGNNPLANFVGGFMSVGGLNVTTEVIPYREGGFNTSTQKMPGQSDFAPITLTTGLIIGRSEMIQEMARLFQVNQGTRNGDSAHFRYQIHIGILQHPSAESSPGSVPISAGFIVYNAWITSLAFSDMDAGANSLSVQQLTLAHEGFDVGLVGNYNDTLTKGTDVSGVLSTNINV